LIPAQQVYQRDMKWLEQCDLFLAEVSGSSFGLGFEAGYLLGGSSKRVILFYKREIAHKISLLITGNSHPNCVLVPYTDVVELEKFVSDHVELPMRGSRLLLLSMFVVAGTLALRKPCSAQRRPYIGVMGGVSTLSADARTDLDSNSATTSSYKPENGPTAGV